MINVFAAPKVEYKTASSKSWAPSTNPNYFIWNLSSTLDAYTASSTDKCPYKAHNAIADDFVMLVI